MRTVEAMASQIAAVALLSLAFLAAGIETSAATLVVTKTADTADGICDTDCSLREAVAAAASGDTVVFSPPFNESQTITLVLGQIRLGRDLTIAGPGSDTLAIRGNNVGRIFNIRDGAVVTLSGLTLRDGRVTTPESFGGAILMVGSTLNLSNVTVTNNYVRYTGTNPPVVLGYGGGIYSENSFQTVSNTVIKSNESPDGAGIMTNGGTVYAVNTSVSYNLGTGLQNQGGTITQVSTSTFDNNSRSGVIGGSYTSILNSKFTNNGATAVGSGDSSSTLLIQNSEISNNNTLPGGDGGGIRSLGFARIKDCTIKNNYASRNGGGISNTGAMYVESTTLLGNTAQESGGAAATSAPLYLTNSTLSGNQANANGGAIYDLYNVVNTSGQVTLTNSTVTLNAALGFGGGLRQDPGGTTNVRNSIIAGNTSNGGQPDISGTVISQGYNLIGTTTGSSGWIAADLLNTNPMLAPLGNNGSTMTHALRPMSPAINAGNRELGRDPLTGEILPSDQRGSAREVGSNIDIGAHESNISTSPVRLRGRLLTSDGRGISGTILSLTDENGVTIYAMSNPFGYYRFLNLPPGMTYVLTLKHKLYSFNSPQTLTMEVNRNDFDLIGIL